MSESKTSKLKPTILRLLLAISLFLVAILAVVGFVFAQKMMGDYALEVSHKKVDAAASENSLQTLQSVEKQLSEDSDLIEKAKNLKHNSSLPQFKAIEDLQAHAANNNITLNDVSFASADTGSAAPAAAGTAPAATPAPAATTTPPASGVMISFSINDGVVDTIDFVNFLHDIEHSIPKMQIKGVSVKPGPSSNQLTVEAMNVTMLTEQTQ